MIVILGTLAGIYVFPTIYNDYLSNDDLDSMSRKQVRAGVETFDQRDVRQKKEDEADKFAQNAIDAIKKKAQDHVNKRIVSKSDNDDSHSNV